MRNCLSLLTSDMQERASQTTSKRLFFRHEERFPCYEMHSLDLHWGPLSISAHKEKDLRLIIRPIQATKRITELCSEPMQDP